MDRLKENFRSQPEAVTQEKAAVCRDLMTISEVSKQFQISTRMLRYYENGYPHRVSAPGDGGFVSVFRGKSGGYGATDDLFVHKKNGSAEGKAGFQIVWL